MILKGLHLKSAPRSEKWYFTQYNDNTYRITRVKSVRESGWETEQTKENFIIPQVENEEVQRCSLSRTKRRIRELSLANNFSHFATITINSNSCDRYSLEEVQNLLKKTIKAYKRKYGDFAYLFITEKHKDGAFHFHGLVKGLSDNDLYINNNGFYSSHMFDTIGFNSFSIIKEYNKTCNYIMKYITKECVKNANNQIYIRSRNLIEPLHYEISPLPPTFNFKFSNDYVDISDFCNLDMSPHELLNMINYLSVGGNYNILSNNIIIKAIKLYNIVKNKSFVQCKKGEKHGEIQDN